MKISAGGAWQAKGGLLIGPFAFGAAGGTSSEHDHFSSNDGTMTLTNNGAWPYILAFVSNWLVPPSGAALTGRPSAPARPRRQIARR